MKPFKNYSCRLLMVAGLLVAFHLQAINTVNYTARNGLVSNAVRKIFVDASHRIWLGTENGVSVLTSNGFSNTVFEDNWDHNMIWEIHEAPDSTIWLGMLQQALYKRPHHNFQKIPLAIDPDPNLIRKMQYYDNQLYIASDAGLFVLDNTTKKQLTYTPVGNNGRFQVMNFFIVDTLLYFQTYQHGFYRIDSKRHTYERISHPFLATYNIFTTQLMGDTVYICREIGIPKHTRNVMRMHVRDLIEGRALIDSLQLNNIAWRFARTPDGSLFAACWGVNDGSGGLYKQMGHTMKPVNADYAVDSKQLWDIVYHPSHQKLYIASLDKGLFVVDLHTILQKNAAPPIQNPIDVLVMDNDVYVLTADSLFHCVDNQVVKGISHREILAFIRSTPPLFACRPLYEMPLVLGQLMKLNGRVGLTTNKGLFFLSRTLTLDAFIQDRGMIHAAVLPNNDLMFSTTYSATRLFSNAGFGQHHSFPVDKPDNPRNVTHSCTINDSLQLLSSYSAQFFLYNLNRRQFKRFDHFGSLKLPCFIAGVRQNEGLMLDKANHLYRFRYTNNHFHLSKWYDFSANGVVESFFLRYFEPYTVVGTDKGLFILTDTARYLINESLGLPVTVQLRDVQLMGNKLVVATNNGIYTVDLDALKNYTPSYDINVVQVKTNGDEHGLTVGDKHTLSVDPGALTITWEMNQHPYPENVAFDFMLSNQNGWQPVVQPGYLRIDHVDYGETTVFLRLIDATNGYESTIRLVTLYRHRPFYKTLLFGFMATALLIGVLLFLLFRHRLNRLQKQKEQALEETAATRQQLEVLRYLLKPHFLFNALTSIQNLIMEKDYHRSLTYTSYFAKFLRGILDDSGDQLIPLEAELKNIEHYVSLERLRFNEQVSLIVNIDPCIDPETHLVVPFLFQPLFENSFKHAFSATSPHPTITLAIHKTAASTVYTITDNGKGLGGQTFEDLFAKTSSKGLKIFLSQLDRHYKERYSIATVPVAPSGTSLTIELFD